MLVTNLTESEWIRLWSKIHIDTSSGCWIWTGARTVVKGYGVLNFRGVTHAVHRLMYAELIAPLPTGPGSLVLDHEHCDTPPCCNPFHLVLKTQGANALRGDNPASRNAIKTHCIRGHLLPPPVEEVKGQLTRRCVICRRLRNNRRYHANKLTG